MNLFESKKTDYYKEGLKDGVESTKNKIQEITKQNKQAEIDLINSINNLSEINDIILEKMSDEEKEQLYGLNQKNNNCYDFSNDDLNRFILGFINFLSSEIYKEHQLTEYQKTFIGIMQKITGIAITSEKINYEYLLNIEELQDNLFIYNIICDFLLLGDEEISNQLLNEIGSEINLSNRLKEDILKSKKEFKGKYGDKLTIMQYVNIVKDTEVNDTLVDKINIEVNENELSQLLKYWKTILDYLSREEDFVCIKNIEDFESKHRIGLEIEKKSLEKEFKVSDVVACSDSFILSKEKFYMYPDTIINFSEIVNYHLNENYVQLFKDNYINNNSEKNYHTEKAELFIELSNEKVIQFSDLSQFHYSVDAHARDMFLMFLFNVLELFLKQELISKEENNLYILAVYCGHHLYGDGYNLVNEKNVYLEMKIFFNNIKELTIQKNHQNPFSFLDINNQLSNIASIPISSIPINKVAKSITKTITNQSAKKSAKKITERNEQELRFSQTPDTILINADGLYINGKLEFTLDQLKTSRISFDYTYNSLKFTEKNRICEVKIYHRDIGFKYLYCEDKYVVMYTSESSLESMTELINLFILLSTI